MHERAGIRCQGEAGRVRNQEKTKSSFKSLVTDIRKTLLEELEQAASQRYSLSAIDRSKVQLSYQEQMDYKRLTSWLNDPSRIHSDPKQNLKELIKERAYTLTNRLVILMQLECRGIRKVKLISRGLENSAFRKEQEFFIALTQGDDQGFRFILQQVWDQLALELPALFEYNEIHECIPLPGPVLLSLIEKLNDEKVTKAWTDDTTLGWLYQYWNDPDRKAVDDKINNHSGKVEIHELSDKTQLFTENYMVEWLVQNSLGAQWLALCKKNGWTCSAFKTIDDLQARRVDWTSETEAMPTQGMEEFWKYYVPQEITQETIEAAPSELSQVKILDPAMGSGHFLVYVFDFLYELYREEASFLGKDYTPQNIVQNILEKNLHGIDIDNRAVQIGAAALYIKTQEKNPGFTISKLNLVASDLGLSHLQKDDPGVLDFTSSLEEELGIHADISYEIIKTLQGAEYLGSLLQVDNEIDRIIESFRVYNQAEDIQEVRAKILSAIENFIHNHDQGEDLGVRSLAEQMGKGLRLIELLGQKYDVIVANPPYLSSSKVADGMENLFIEGTSELYEVMVIRSKTWLKEAGFLAFLTTHNFMFLDKFKDFRSFIAREGAVHRIAQLGVWTFTDVSQPGALGIALFIWQNIAVKKDVASFQRIGKGQHRTDPRFEDKIPYLVNQINTYSFPQSRFAEIPGSPMIYWWPEEYRQAYLKAPKLIEITSVRTGMSTSNNPRYLRYFWETNLNKINYRNQLKRWEPYIKGSAGGKWFQGLAVVINWQSNGKDVKVYNFGASGGRVQNTEYFFRQGIGYSKIGTSGFPCCLRKYPSVFDGASSSIFCENPEKMQVLLSSSLSGYVSQSINPTINNQVGDIEKIPVLDQLQDYTLYLNRAYELYDELFSSTESNLEYSYNHLSPEKFEIEEFRIRDDIDKELMAQFSQETKTAIYREIGESSFNYPQWDGSDSTIPDDFSEQYQKESSILALSSHNKLHPESLLQIKEKLGLVHKGQRKDKAFKDLSWAIGVLLGRFDSQTGGLIEMADEGRKGQGLTLDLSVPQSQTHGLLYLSTLDEWNNLERTTDTNRGQDCLNTLQSILTYKWDPDKAHGLWDEIEAALVLDCQTDWTAAQRNKKNLNNWIRTKAFGMHESIYQKRPIYFPLVSAKKSFFLWINIHQWNHGTLNAVLANYLNPDINTIDTRISRLREDVQKTDDAKYLNSLESEISQLSLFLEELMNFANKVNQLANEGPAPNITEQNLPYAMDLDDGVMVNSSALWELVLPLWKEPKKWWISLSKPAGNKDFDWSHLAMRYWPERVMEKVKKDPSLAVAHSEYGEYKGRDFFKEFHPEAAKKWDEQQEKKKDLELDFG
jgi:Eco57I restriction-modification methylase